MNRRFLQELSEIRIKEADCLLKNRQYSGAYYLAGYAVECALKACIAKKIRRFEFPDKKFVIDSYTHDLTKLIKIAGLESDHKGEQSTNANFSTNWAIVKEWDETSRYETFNRVQSKELIDAITSTTGGVLLWIRKYW